jgi:hypothetical protein
VAATDVVFYYNTPKRGVQGPCSLEQLRGWQPELVRLNRWTTLRVWREGQTEAQAVLVTSLLP